MKDINVFEYLDERPDAEDILALIAESLVTDFVSCEAKISEIEPDDFRFVVSMFDPWHRADGDDDRSAFRIFADDNALAAAGLSATVSDNGECEYEGGYLGTAYCAETVTLYVSAPEKFEEWVNERESAKHEKAA